MDQQRRPDQMSPFVQMGIPGTVVEVGMGDQLDPLLPGEAPPGTDPAGRRHWELLAGRHCAAQALSRVGVPRQPLLPDAAGVPRWPRGWIGSITHSGGRCAAAVASDSAVAAIGIDMERPRPISVRAARRVCTAEELAAGAVCAPPGAVWPLLVFSAKESFYKAWWPRYRRPLAFHALQVELTTLAEGAGSLRFVPGDASGAGGVRDVEAFEGRVQVDGGWVRTAVWSARR